LWNLAFCNVRSSVENSYQKTGACMLLYLDRVLFLAIHAAVGFHYYIMNTEHFSYSSLKSVDNMCVNNL
jgi:hypothetical protein